MPDTLANLVQAISAPKALPLPLASLRDLRAVRLEHRSVFTQVIRGP